ncbi:unnamed protein product, partial [Vitis vinifera]
MQSHTEESSTSTSSTVVSSTPPLVDDIYTQVMGSERRGHVRGLGIEGPSEGVPRVLLCFSNNLLYHEPLKLVDGGQSQRTFVYIKDAIEEILVMIVIL